MAEERINPEAVESSNTAEDARLTRALLEPHLPCTVTVVTSDFHAARAGLLFREEFDASPLELTSAPTPAKELVERMQFEVDALMRLTTQVDRNISLPHHGTWITFRVAAVLMADNRVLLQQAGTSSFWFLPGGRVQVDESTDDAIRRELVEELPFDAEVDRLLWTVENFFTNDRNRVHEVGFYFLAHPGANDLRGYNFTDGGVEISCRWFPVPEIPALDVRPRFLVEALGDLPSHPQHITFRD